MRALYPCHLCQLLGKGDDAWKPVEDFGCRRSSELVSKVLSQGCWRRCVECSNTVKANKATTAAAGVREADKLKRMEEAGELTLVCKICKNEKEHHCFPIKIVRNRHVQKPRCTDCHQIKCRQCGVLKHYEEFYWNRQVDPDGTSATLCYACDLHECQGPCGKKLSRKMFSTQSWKNYRKMNTPLRCEACFVKYQTSTYKTKPK